MGHPGLASRNPWEPPSRCCIPQHQATGQVGGQEDQNDRQPIEVLTPRMGAGVIGAGYLPSMHGSVEE